MVNRPDLEFTIGLSEEEKHDLEQMIGDFQKERSTTAPENDLVALQKQIDEVNKQLAYLSATILNLDRRLKPLYKIIHLMSQKSDLLHQRINTIFDALRSGEPLK